MLSLCVRVCVCDWRGSPTNSQFKRCLGSFLTLVEQYHYCLVFALNHGFSAFNSTDAFLSPCAKSNLSDSVYPKMVESKYQPKCMSFLPSYILF